MVKKLFSTFLLIGLLFPIISEAGVSPEGRPNRPRSYYPEGRPKKKKCKGSGGVLVCRVPKPRKPKKCTIKKPCIPKGYYRKNPPKFIRMG